MKKHSKRSAFDLQYNFSDYPYMHSHDFWEFMIVTEGSYLHRINGKAELITKNTCYLLRPKDRHSLHTLNASPKHINLAVSADILKKQLDLLSKDAYKELLESADEISFTISEMSCQSYVQKVLTAQKNQNDPDSYHYWVAQIFLSCIKDLFYNHFMKDGQHGETYLPDYLEQTINLLNDSNNFDLPLKEIVQKTSYSYVHISRTFKDCMKMGLSDYFLAVKMNYARALLEQGDSVLSVSTSTGYSTQSHFNTAFKKFYSMTPLQYKKNWAVYYDNLEDDKRD